MPSESIITRDANRVPYTRFGAIAKTTLNLTGNNETVTSPLFRIYGSVEIVRLYGIVTATIGAATATTSWTLSDSDGSSTAISGAAGTDISDRAPGTLLIRRGLSANVLVIGAASTASVTDVGGAGNKYISSLLVGIEKTGNVASYLNFVYATTSTPTSGAIDFYCGWVPLSAGSRLETL